MHTHICKCSHMCTCNQYLTLCCLFMFRCLAQRACDLLPHTDIYNIYGPTEATIWVSSWRCNGGNYEGVATSPIGTPTANTQLYVLNKQLQPVLVGGLLVFLFRCGAVNGSSLTAWVLNASGLQAKARACQPAKRQCLCVMVLVPTGLGWCAHVASAMH